MAKNIDYAKIKAMASSILECIGDESEGEAHEAMEKDEAMNNGGQDSMETLKNSAPKKDKEGMIGLMASTLASKFKK